MKHGIIIFSLAALSLLPLRAAGAIPASFLEAHCTDCHDAETKKGGLDLTALDSTFSDSAAWVRVHDKIASGEMPPKKKERPPAVDVKAVTDYLGSQLHTFSLKRQKAEGRVASRRMNRTEYENTPRELFGVPVRVKELLPEDGTVGGFDTVASVLTVSPAHLVAYQRAADAALDAVITSSTKREFRESFTGREWFDREVKGNRKHVPGGAAAEGEIAVLHHQTQQHWELNVMPREAAKVPGVYRVGATVPAIACDWLDIEGPLHDVWSPRSHRALFSELPLAEWKADANPGVRTPLRKSARTATRSWTRRALRWNRSMCSAASGTVTAS